MEAFGDRERNAVSEPPVGGVICYPGIGKKKGMNICRAFAEGCGGRVQDPGTARELAPGGAFFYGTTSDNQHLFDQAQREGRDWYYADNAYYFGRGKFFRITKGALQHDGTGTADPERFWRFNVPIRRWRTDGRHIVIATQSNLWHRRWHGAASSRHWAQGVRAEIAKHTDRKVIIVCKPEAGAMKPEQAHSPDLETSLGGAWALVTHTSSAAVCAVLRGIPVFALAPCAASVVGLSDLAEIERPHMPDDPERLRWASVLAANQFTLDEMRSGDAWRTLNG